MSGPFDLTGQAALVTGANTGLGQAIAVALAEAGADIAAVGRTAPAETQGQVEAAGVRFAWIEADLSDIAIALRGCERAMDTWRTRDPRHIRLHRYEALLDNPEARIRALLDDCGLPFDAACLDFHRSQRSVRTASAAQVRQPLRGDTARAHLYGPLLDPLRKALGD